MIVRQVLQLSGTHLGRTLLAGFLIAGMGGASATVSDVAPSRTPFQIVATGFEQPTGLVVHPQGFLLVTDRKTGVLYRLTPGFTAAGAPAFTGEVLFAGLDEPIGVAVDRDGNLLVAESDKDRVVRFEKLGEVFSAVPEPVAEGLKEPRWLVVDGEGTIFLSADGIKQDRLAKGRPKPKDEVLLKITPDGVLSVVADGFKELSGLAIGPGGHLLGGATQRRSEKGKSDGRIFKIRLPDGQVSRVVTGGLKGPQDLKFDVVGALFFTAKEFREGRDPDDDDRAEPRASGKHKSEGRNEDDREDLDDDERSQPGKGVILKATFKHDGTLDRLTQFAAGLGKPAGAAFDKDGNLYVAERNDGRVLRFQAPDPPVLDQSLPRHTNQATLMVRGTAAPDAIITLLSGAVKVSGKTEADGTFILAVPLIPNTEQTLHVYATSRGGDGLTSGPKVVTVTHDDQPPDTRIAGCPSGVLTSPTFTFSFTGPDNFTQPEHMRFAHSLDGTLFSDFTTDSAVTLTKLAPGSHTFQVKAEDQAGNADETPADCTFTVILLNVTINSPDDNETINADRTFVNGTVTDASTEVGVVVNGVLALVSGQQWVAEVPLVLGSNRITVIATDTQGASATAGVTVQVDQPQEPLVTLQASPVSGLAPLTVRFTVEADIEESIVQYAFDQNGDGVAELIRPVFDDVQVTYTESGFITPRVTLTNDKGRTFTATSTIQVLDRAATIVMLKAKWENFTTALGARDIPQALAEMAVGVRRRYEETFQALDANLPSIAATLGQVAIIDVSEGMAEGVIQRVVDGQTFLFFVYWAPDADGIWRIIEM